MASFSQDRKWLEAKRAVGNLNWLEVIRYYRSINGTNVFVYSVIEGDKRLIADVLDDGHILLVNKHGEPVFDSYENVLNSRKIFKYNEDFLVRDLCIGSDKYRVVLESHK